MTTAESLFEVDGLPPENSEARSLLGATHPHSARVRQLLQVAQAAAAGARFHPLSGRTPHQSGNHCTQNATEPYTSIYVRLSLCAWKSTLAL